MGVNHSKIREWALKYFELGTFILVAAVAVAVISWAIMGADHAIEEHAEAIIEKKLETMLVLPKDSLKDKIDVSRGTPETPPFNEDDD